VKPLRQPFVSIILGVQAFGQKREAAMRFILSFAFVAVGLASCNNSKPNVAKPDDKLIYDAGHEDGVIETCSQIDRYNDTMWQSLVEAKICPSR
jgi:hypothetical protein